MSEIQQVTKLDDLINDHSETTAVTSRDSIEPNAQTKREDGFVSRVSSLPIVLAVVYWTSEAYKRVKSSNSFTQQVCERVEVFVKQGMQQVDKMMSENKLVSDRVSQLDALACGVLTRVESAWPAVIRSEPSDVITYVCGKWTSLKEVASLRAQTERLRDAVESQTSQYVAKLSNIYSEARKRVTVQVQDKLSLTKDKIELYREYLDVLSKQFVVQDGRSLEHIHSVEERTKVIIRRNIGNFITAVQILCSKLQQLKSATMATSGVGESHKD